MLEFLSSLTRRRPPPLPKPVKRTFIPFGYVPKRTGPDPKKVTLTIFLLIIACLLLFHYYRHYRYPCGGPDDLPLGDVLGHVHGVAARSNCHDSVITNEFVRVMPNGDVCAETDANGVERLTEAGHQALKRAQDWHAENNDKLRNFLIKEYQLSPTDNVSARPEMQAPSEHTFVCGVRTGMRWQCVEYVRRYLYLRYGAVFDSIEGGEDLFAVREVYKVPLYANGTSYTLEEAKQNPDLHFPFDAFSNGGAEQPLPGDILVWSRQKDMPYGHVAVISDIVEAAPRAHDNLGSEYNTNLHDTGMRDENQAAVTPTTVDPALAVDGIALKMFKVRIGEQNFASRSWGGRSFGRSLKLMREEQYASQVRYSLSDPFGYSILGWMRPNGLSLLTDSPSF